MSEKEVMPNPERFADEHNTQPSEDSAKPLAARSAEFRHWPQSEGGDEPSPQADADEIVKKMNQRNATVWPDTLWLSAASLIERQAAEIASLTEHLDRANQLDVQRIAEIERLRKSLNEKETFRGRTY